ncbi:hypothetical protein K32_29970 [Kaistia sp. 32K]|uniref:hypothetical protein n=1 Tax=Kaistia sp. 32K TaxID=2795690 RepID=UPI0019165AF2|nr:hypothetical protein [Kaistia sp. 32K]BCP54380.1 hypothetical protein K32_29970 [Kaistia sp. 32K]
MPAGRTALPEISRLRQGFFAARDPAVDDLARAPFSSVCPAFRHAGVARFCYIVAQAASAARRPREAGAPIRAP